VGIRCADHVTPLSAKMTLTLPTYSGSSVGIVRLRTKTTEIVCLNRLRSRYVTVAIVDF
jgi:hypothetical protein